MFTDWCYPTELNIYQFYFIIQTHFSLSVILWWKSNQFLIHFSWWLILLLFLLRISRWCQTNINHAALMGHTHTHVFWTKQDTNIQPRTWQNMAFSNKFSHLLFSHPKYVITFLKFKFIYMWNGNFVHLNHHSPITVTIRMCFSETEHMPKAIRWREI